MSVEENTKVTDDLLKRLSYNDPEKPITDQELEDLWNFHYDLEWKLRLLGRDFYLVLREAQRRLIRLRQLREERDESDQRDGRENQDGRSDIGRGTEHSDRTPGQGGVSIEASGSGLSAGTERSAQTYGDGRGLQTGEE